MSWIDGVATEQSGALRGARRASSGWEATAPPNEAGSCFTSDPQGHLVDRRSVTVEPAPASSVIRRFPAELADVLRRQKVPGAFIDKELSKMNEAVCLPTASRSMLGVGHWPRIRTHGRA